MGDHVRARIEALKGAAIDLLAGVLSDGHLAQEVEKLGLPPEPTRLLAARALVAELGRLDPAPLKEIERGLSHVPQPDARDAAAIAFLVVRRLPVTPELALMVQGRHDAPQTSGERLRLMVEQVSLQWGSEDESRLPAQGTPPTRVPHLAEGLERLFSTIPPERRSALAEAVARLLSSFAPDAATSTFPPDEAASTFPSRAGQGPAPELPHGAPSPTPGAAPASPPASAAGSLPAVPSSAPGAPEAPPATIHEAILRVYRALPPARQPAFEAALEALLTTFLADAAPDGEPQPAPQAPPPPLAPRAEALAHLRALALPEGGRRPEMEAALRRLVAAMVPPEADLARLERRPPAEAAQEAAVPRERLAEVLERVVERHPADPDARALRDEIRFGQLRAAGQDDLALTIPLWWSRGSGEIRVHDGGAQAAPGAPSGASRVVIALDTPHLKGIRIDLLLHQGQVNCQVSLQDPGAAAFVEARLSELRGAIEDTGLRVGALGLRREGRRPKAAGPAPAAGEPGTSGVDFYG